MEPSWSILATCALCGTSYTALEDTTAGLEDAASRLADHARRHHGLSEAASAATSRLWLCGAERELESLLRGRATPAP